MSRSTDICTITREEIASLRKASTIAFRHAHGVSQIEGARGYDNLTIVRVGSYFVDYSEPRPENPVESYNCWWFSHFNSANEPVNTFLRLLKPGDGIRAYWYRDNTSYCQKLADCYRDELRVEIIRNPDHRKPTYFTFLLEVEVRPNKMLGRMISPKGVR